MSLEILFNTGTDTSSKSDIEKLRQVSGYLNKNKGFKIRLSGHTDIIGTDKYNNIQSLERAKSVANILNSEGIHTDKIITEGFGSSRPTSSEIAEDQKANNRRVNIDIIFDEDTAELTMLEGTLL